MSIRLVSYNILEGLLSVPRTEGSLHILDPRRVEAAQAVVGALQPDILVLNEALYCRPFDGASTDYAALFGFAHEAGALYDGAWGNAILSRFPITASREMRTVERGGLGTLIETAAGPLTVATYHPHPERAPAAKAEDYAKLVTGITGPAIVCGDFNAISPDDNADLPALQAAFARFSATPAETLDRFIASGEEIFGTLSALGFRDAIPNAGRRYSIPTDLLSPDKSSAIRIDHILANADVRIISGEVIHSTHSNLASDHHPVAIVFEPA